MSRAVVVSIGRNVDGAPMSASEWLEFQLDLGMMLPGPAVFAGLGSGQYGGQTEESFTVVMADVSDKTLADLRPKLAGLAHAYKQKCVALTVGVTTFPGL